MKQLFLLATILICQLAMAQKKVNPILKQVPSIALYDLEGQPFNLANMAKGKVIVIDCWFLPCAPCFEEMPMLHDLHAKFKNNSQFRFITITRTDTSLIRPMVEKDTTATEVYHYYQKYSGMDEFNLPVYFIPGCNEKLHNFAQTKVGFKGRNVAPDDSNKCPDVIFNFVGFPTLLIYDKKGKLIYSKNGFTKDLQKTQQQEMEKIIAAHLAAR